ncbi:MAG: F0F1 ATP synthase subunit alpha [Culicoidibacterales bacterium]
MSLKPEELSRVLAQKLKDYEQTVDYYESGVVVKVGDGVATANGLDNIMMSELVEFADGTLGMAINLEMHTVGIVMLSESDQIREGSIVKRTGRIVEVPVGDGLLGRVVNPLGEPIDGKGELVSTATRPIERIAPGVMTRKSVHQPLQTGIKAIDAMFPIGRGQRELIIGDRQTGKTAIAIDTILNQKGENVKCIYVAIGQKNSTIASVYNTLLRHGAMEYTTIVAASASDMAPVQYLAPYAGCAIGEEWMDNGEDVLIVYDDLSKHAVAYRTLSLLLRRPPGREAYPGDVFYLHSRLLERACKLNADYGGGSMTALPIIETQAGDISAYIPTNVISITDGQIFLQADLFNAGQRPAIDTGLSVSRVGGDAQTKIVKKLSGSMKIDLAQYSELQAFAQFSSDLDATTKAVLDRGAKLMEMIKQPVNQPVRLEEQVVLLFVAQHGYLAKIAVNQMKRFEKEVLEFFEIQGQDTYALIREQKALTPEVEAALRVELDKFMANFAVAGDR